LGSIFVVEWKTAIEKKSQLPSKYAIQRGNQIIAKFVTSGVTQYELWNGEERIGHWLTPAEAKAKADALIADS
jgi:hypothetical protein